MQSLRVDPGDPAYPSALVAAGSPPLFLRGALPAQPGVAVVGTREPSDEAVAFTRALVHELGREGLAIWSGGARGIDAAAHEAALEVGAPTVVVAGGGLDRPYPKDHIALYARVLAKGGALLARVGDAIPPSPYGFLLRNQLLAALGAATVVIQAGYASGARNTAAAARRFGRPLGAVPHAPWDARGAGCALELTLGARPITSAADVLALLGIARPARRRRPRPSGLLFDRALPDSTSMTMMPPPSPEEPALEEGESAIFSAMSPNPAHLDEICARSERPPAEVIVILLTLTLRAVVVEGPAGFFRLARRP